MQRRRPRRAAGRDRRRRRRARPQRHADRRRGAWRGPRLKVVARAGVGSTTSTCPQPPRPASWWSTPRRPTSSAPPSWPSHCCSAAARHIAPANAALRAGEWKRSRYTGVEVVRQGGRRGRPRPNRRARRAAADGRSGPGSSRTTRTCSRARAAQIGIQLVGLDELLAQSDFITVHLPKTPETVGLIGEEALTRSSRASSSSTPHAVASSTRPRSQRGRRRPGGGRRHRRLRARSRAPTRRCSSSTGLW